jgi:uncharacterized damage-inducible protein DinB
MTRSLQRLAIVALMLAPTVLPAQKNPDKPAKVGAKARVEGLKADIAAQLQDAHTKLVALANAIPAEKFSWRPAAGVRSSSEVFVHVAMENFEIPPMAGIAAATTKVADNAEKSITSKAAVIDLLEKSFAYAEASVMAARDAQMDVQGSYFGTPMSNRAILMQLALHGHEHLGQMIAYARMNSIVPPWSQ